MRPAAKKHAGVGREDIEEAEKEKATEVKEAKEDEGNELMILLLDRHGLLCEASKFKEGIMRTRGFGC